MLINPKNKVSPVEESAVVESFGILLVQSLVSLVLSSASNACEVEPEIFCNIKVSFFKYQQII